MSSGTETPRKRRGKGRQRSPANGSTPSIAAAASGGGGVGGGGGGSCPSAKKLKIFDYFGIGTPSTPQATKESAGRAAGNGRRDDAIGSSGGDGGRVRSGEVNELTKTGALARSFSRGACESDAVWRDGAAAVFVAKGYKRPRVSCSSLPDLVVEW